MRDGCPAVGRTLCGTLLHCLSLNNNLTVLIASLFNQRRWSISDGDHLVVTAAERSCLQVESPSARHRELVSVAGNIDAVWCCVGEADDTRCALCTLSRF